MGLNFILEIALLMRHKNWIKGEDAAEWHGFMPDSSAQKTGIMFDPFVSFIPSPYSVQMKMHLVSILSLVQLPSLKPPSFQV